MKKVICTNGHFYDADRFDCCPICGKGCGEALPRPQAFESEATVPLPHSFAVDELASTAWISPDEMQRLWGDDAPAFSPESERAPAPPQVDELAPTMWTESSLEIPDDVPKETDTEKADWLLADEPTGEPVKELVKEPAREPNLTLAQMIAALDSQQISPVTPVAEPEKPETIDLPVGWLVGLSVSSRGKLFPCKPGRNRIGRAPQMDISLPLEASIDLNTHAQIIYDPKDRQFYVQAGDGIGLVYRNGNLVFTHEKLHAYDRVTLGKAEFIFVPLCGEHFDWGAGEE